MAALKVTGDVLERHSDILDAYVPDPATVGVLFEESNYHLDWAQYGASCEQAGQSVLGYLRALERVQVPYEVVDSGHMQGLDGLRLLIMPWPLIVAPAAAEQIADWVEGGGTLLAESELGAYDQHGFYFYPDERALATRLGIRSLGRRVIQPQQVVVRAEGGPYHLGAASWVEAFDPGDATVMANMGEEVVATISKRGEGKVVSVGTFLGLAYSRERNPDFERFVGGVVDASGARPNLVSSVPDGEHLQWRLGTAGAQRALFVTTDDGPVELTFRAPADIFAPGDELVELIEGTRAKVQSSQDGNLVTLKVPGHGFAVWRWGPGAGS